MRVLTRHVATEFLRVLGICFTAGAVLFLVIDVLERVDSFNDSETSVRVTALFFVLRIPELVFELIPVSMLVATAVSVGRLSQTNEITAMKAGGVSVHRAVVVPLTALGLVVAVACMGVNEWLVPWTKGRSRAIMLEVKGRRHEIHLPEKVEEVWFHARPQMVRVGAYYPDLDVLEDITVHTLNDDFRPVRQLYAGTARWLDAEHGFRLTDVIDRDLRSGTQTSSPTLDRTFAWTLEDIRLAGSGKRGRVKDLKRISQQMSFFTLLDHIRKVEAAGYPSTPYWVDLHDKVAFPFVCVLVPILAIPFSLVRSRGGGLVRALALSVVVGVSYFFVHSLMLSLGRVGRLPPAASAWAANVLYLAVGSFRLARIRQ